MVAFASVLVSLLLAASVACSPVLTERDHGLGINMWLPPFNANGLFCSLPMVPSALCPRQAPPGASVKTPLGTAVGTLSSHGGSRFAVKYGSADRWQNSKVVSSWQLPDGSTDATVLPLPCPQNSSAVTNFTEDCLSMLIYVPSSLKAGGPASAPTLVWIHGGSFILGSATDPGLDGTILATATNSIVAVIQYRLGSLGFNSPDGRTNFALQDITTALRFLQEVVPSFGGDPTKITVAGQSSGANMIRALLAVPSASSLFHSAILQSDPMDYGFQSPKTQTTLQNYFNSLISCAPTDTECLNSMSLEEILTAQSNLYDNAIDLDPSATQDEPIRPVHDGTFITSTLDSSTPFPKVSKPILLSTVLNEAAVTIYGSITEPLPASAYKSTVEDAFGQSGAQTILNFPTYEVPVVADGDPDARVQLQVLGTDQVWRCATWTFARNWANNGGAAFVGLYTVGASYPGNSEVPICTEPGVVCHQDDIEIVFGTVPNPDSAQSALVTEMQARYNSFLHLGTPNPSGQGYLTWSPVTNSSVPALLLGTRGEAEVGGCEPSIWGETVLFDYQVYDI